MRKLSFAPIDGRLVLAGDLTIDNEVITGIAIEIPREKLKGRKLPLYMKVTIMPTGFVDGWTIKYSDYVIVRDALSALASACKRKLPPGFFAEIAPEYNDAKSALGR